ncbi:hypothetical protein [Cloacibacillus evryensis]|uniref:Restriction endonuclease subunit S n=1 Tax=Cloacibacillus evryensis TaxID=508460 RepID=A0AAW5K9C3_9BACT|nr:hypothetical protein [Cloacibacillus evryensis]MCQ4815363.1 hypothetical protein [Cloacibacillus evryensis]
MFNGYIDVAKGFQTSVNIAYDLNNAEKVRGFIPTQSSLDVIEDVLLSTADNATQRARMLIGAYGRGKSHIILVLMALLSKKDKTLFPSLLEKMKEANKDLYEFSLNYLNRTEKLLPIIVRGSNSSLSSSFLNALQLTLSEDNLSDVMPETHFQAAITAIEIWKREFKDTYNKFSKALGKPVDQFILALQEFDVASYDKFTELYPKLTSGSTFNPFLGFDVVDLYENVAQKLKTKGYSGVYVVYDEFSKYLESSIANATISDIKLLQDFAEKCSRSGNSQMHLLLICHKDIANYIDDGLPKEKIDGWRGVSGRFKHINLHNNYAQMYEIISAVIKKSEPFWAKYQEENAALFSELSSRFSKNGLLDATNTDEVINAVYGCYPMHPVSTFILPRLSERVAQNERTLFTFLSSDDRYTLSAFLRAKIEQFPLVTPDYIYDYFEPLLRKEPYTSEAHKIYKLISTVLQKVESHTLEAKILKTIALIYLVEQFEKLPPIVDVISDSFRDVVEDPKSINDALTSLIDKECIVYLKRSNGYLRIKESSGVDIPSEITAYIDRNRSVLKVTEILNRSAFDSYLYPTGYNDRFEITRYFDFTFIDGKEFFSIQDFEARIAASDADGIIYAVIPRNIDELKRLETVVRKAERLTERLVIILPSSFEDIEKIAFEYEAVKKQRERVPETEPILADEYDIYIDDLTEVIGAFINNYARPENGNASYYYKGKKQQIYRKAQLTGLLSRICEEVFCRTPVINNESVNKNTLPSVTINSRTKILAGLLENEIKPNLGLTGTGQEVSIMRSTLIQTGVLISPTDNPQINLVPKDVNLAFMLAQIQEFFSETSATGTATFEKLYGRLTKPQYGIGLKRGIIPIYLATVLHLNKQNLVIKYNGKEERITPDLLNGINESPSEYAILVENWSATKATYITALEGVFRKDIKEREKIYNGFAYILYAMNRWYIALPKYAKELTAEYQGRDQKALPLPLSHISFVNSLKMPDENPHNYLFDKLAGIFKLKELTIDLVQLIQSAKVERDNAIRNLVGKLADDIKFLFAGRNANTTLATTVGNWYEKLSERTLRQLFANNENKILTILSSVSNDDSAFVQRLAKAVSGLRIEDWTDGTIDGFFKELSAFKETVDDFNNKKPSDRGANAEYRIVFKNARGQETVRIFNKADYSETAELMLGEVSRVVDEYNQSLTEQEKRQVIMDILERLCHTEG